jgi:ketosteroid isomerase-like protein
MNKDIAQNLAAVENHFHSEESAEVEAALQTFTEDIIWEAPAPNGLNRSFRGEGSDREQLSSTMGLHE